MTLESVAPYSVPAGAAQELTITGTNFTSSISRQLNGNPEFEETVGIEVAVRRRDGTGGGYHILETVQIVDGTHLMVQLSHGLDTGGYMLKVSDAIGRSDELPDAFEVFSGQDTDVSSTATAGDTGETGMATDTENVVHPTDTNTESMDGGGSSIGTDTGTGRDTASFGDTLTEAPSDTGMEEGTDSAPWTDISTSSTLSTASDVDAGGAEDSDTSDTEVFRGDGCDSFNASSLLCDGFENENEYVVWLNEGEVTVTDTMAHSGDASLYATCSVEGGYANIVTEFSPVRSGSVYFRAFYYIPEGTVTGTLKIAGIRGGNDRMMVDINVTTEGRVALYEHGDDRFRQSDPGAYYEGAWFCLSGVLDIDNTAGSINVSVGGTEVVSLDGVDTLPGTGVMAADFGIVWTEAGQVGAELYVDDIVVDVAPVGCQ